MFIAKISLCAFVQSAAVEDDSLSLLQTQSSFLRADADEELDADEEIEDGLTGPKRRRFCNNKCGADFRGCFVPRHETKKCQDGRAKQNCRGRKYKGKKMKWCALPSDDDFNDPQDAEDAELDPKCLTLCSLDSDPAPTVTGGCLIKAYVTGIRFDLQGDGVEQCMTNRVDQDECEADGGSWCPPTASYTTTTTPPMCAGGPAYCQAECYEAGCVGPNMCSSSTGGCFPIGSADECRNAAAPIELPFRPQPSFTKWCGIGSGCSEGDCTTTTTTPGTTTPELVIEPPPEVVDGVSAVDDPHLKSTSGDKFDVYEAGRQTLLTIPQGASAKDALLHLDAYTEKIGDRENDLWIRRLSVQGSWVGKSYSFKTASAAIGSANNYLVRHGKGSWISPEKMAQLEPQTFSALPVKHPKASPEKDFDQSTGSRAQLKVGPITLHVNWATVQKNGEDVNHLDVRLTGMSKVKESMGGLLADEVKFE